MADAKLQALRRAWEQSGAVDDEVAWLREGLRAGELSPEGLEREVFLGSAGAQLISPWSEDLFDRVVGRTPWLSRVGLPHPRDDEVRRMADWSEWLTHAERQLDRTEWANPDDGLQQLADLVRDILQRSPHASVYLEVRGRLYEFVEATIIAGLPADFPEPGPETGLDPHGAAVSNCAWWTALLGCHGACGEPAPRALREIVGWMLDGHWLAAVEPAGWVPGRGEPTWVVL